MVTGKRQVDVIISGGAPIFIEAQKVKYPQGRGTELCCLTVRFGCGEGFNLYARPVVFAALAKAMLYAVADQTCKAIGQSAHEWVVRLETAVGIRSVN